MERCPFLVFHSVVDVVLMVLSAKVWPLCCLTIRIHLVSWQISFFCCLVRLTVLSSILLAPQSQGHLGDLRRYVIEQKADDLLSLALEKNLKVLSDSFPR